MYSIRYLYLLEVGVSCLCEHFLNNTTSPTHQRYRHYLLCIIIHRYAISCISVLNTEYSHDIYVSKEKILNNFIHKHTITILT